jgi:hypothetical protein
MGFMDKVKEQATLATAAAKDAAAKGQSKLDEMSAKKAADQMLRDLGALSYGSVTSRETPTSEADAGRIVAALEAHEQQNGEISLTLESPVGRQGG